MDQDGAQEQDREDVDLNGLAREQCAEYADAARAKNIELAGIGGPGMVFGDPVALSILLRNLIDNGIRYIPAGAAWKSLSIR